MKIFLSTGEFIGRMKNINPSISAYLSKIGKIGGSKKKNFSQEEIEKRTKRLPNNVKKRKIK